MSGAWPGVLGVRCSLDGAERLEGRTQRPLRHTLVQVLNDQLAPTRAREITTAITPTRRQAAQLFRRSKLFLTALAPPQLRCYILWAQACTSDRGFVGGPATIPIDLPRCL